jgi:serine/threonine-protein kinase
VSLSPGQTLDRYVIEEALGAGGMGVVYRAYDPKLARRVALKIVPVPREGSASEITARLLREARAAAALDHPNTLAIFDVGALDGVMYIAMELVPGVTLRERLGAPASVAERVRWLLDVARALAAAHRVGIVHRDVKPENVMIRQDGVVKVLDFGLARTFASVEPVSGVDWARLGPHLDNLTHAGAILGTPLYMAPEQVRGEVVDARADQFAWAVVAFEVFAGARAVGGA